MAHTMVDTLFTCQSKRAYLSSYWDDDKERFVECTMYDYSFWAQAGSDAGAHVEINGVRETEYQIGRDYHIDLNFVPKTA